MAVSLADRDLDNQLHHVLRVADGGQASAEKWRRIVPGSGRARLAQCGAEALCVGSGSRIVVLNTLTGSLGAVQPRTGYVAGDLALVVTNDAKVMVLRNPFA